MAHFLQMITILILTILPSPVVKKCARHINLFFSFLNLWLFSKILKISMTSEEAIYFLKVQINDLYALRIQV